MAMKRYFLSRKIVINQYKIRKFVLQQSFIRGSLSYYYKRI